MNKIVPIALGLAGLILMSCETSSTNDKAASGGASSSQKLPTGTAGSYMLE